MTLMKRRNKTCVDIGTINSGIKVARSSLKGHTGLSRCAFHSLYVLFIRLLVTTRFILQKFLQLKQQTRELFDLFGLQSLAKKAALRGIERDGIFQSSAALI